jgi:hypothetical protein
MDQIVPTWAPHGPNSTWHGSGPIRSHTEAYTSSPGVDPVLFDPIPELIPLLPVWNRSIAIRYRSLYIIYRDESDPIRPGTGAYALSFSVEPILSDPIPKLIHPLPEWIRSYPVRCRSLDPLLPEWIRPDPLRCRSLCILFRNVPDPIRPDTGAHTLSYGVGKILSDPIPESVHYLPEWIRSYPIRYRSLHILSRNGSGPIRSDTRAYAHASGMDPTRSDHIPKLTHILPEWTRPYPTRYRSLYIIFKCGTDPIRSDTVCCTLSSGRDPTLSDPTPKLTHPPPEWVRSKLI